MGRPNLRQGPENHTRAPRLRDRTAVVPPKRQLYRSGAAVHPGATGPAGDSCTAAAAQVAVLSPVEWQQAAQQCGDGATDGGGR